jgi:hypothetical protein
MRKLVASLKSNTSSTGSLLSAFDPKNQKPREETVNQEFVGRKAEYSYPTGGQVQACWPRPMGQVGCSVLCSSQRAEFRMEAKGLSDSFKLVR